MDERIRCLAEAYAVSCRTEQAELLRRLGRIPAPTGAEGRRAAFCRDWLLAQGAEDVTIDHVGNVICRLGPKDAEDFVVFAAHMDIVFPDREPLPMEEREGKLYAPGIGDDTANLVDLLLAARYLIREKTSLRCGVLIVANTCEEGLGNLAGTRALFDAYGSKIRAFYSFDCHLGLCCNQAVGSYRYRITCRTEGGHSYFDFGRPNAAAILCGLAAELYAVPAPEGATYNIGKIEGGTGINVIPQRAELLYEFRSTSQSCLEEMEKRFRQVLANWSDRGGELAVDLLGIRPGNGPVDPAELAQLTAGSVDVIRTFYPGGIDSAPGSTDSNIPLSLGIPANTIGTVAGGGMHTREEWVELDSLPVGLAVALSLMLQYGDEGTFG